MSSELEMTRDGRLRLASLIEREKLTTIREWVAPREDLGYLAAPVLANEERRLKAAVRRRA